MLGPLAFGHLIEPVARLTRHPHGGKQFFVKSFDILFQSATIVVLTHLFVLDKRNTLGNQRPGPTCGRSGCR